MNTPELTRLEAAIFATRKAGRLADIREAWAAWCKTQEPKASWWRRLIDWAETVGYPE